MAKWHKSTHRLKDHHGWKAKPGYNVFVANRGDVRFDYPRDWVVTPGVSSIDFRDKPEPEATCVLQVSVIHQTPGIDWTGLPLHKLLRDSLTDRGDRRFASNIGEILRVDRPDLDAVWTEYQFIDPDERREANARTLVARGQALHVLITLTYWPEDAERCVAVWQEVVRSLQLEVPVADPTHRRLN